MPTMQEMAEAHLSNVSKAVSELEQQKLKIQSEIDNLKSYLVQGQETLSVTSNEQKEN